MSNLAIEDKIKEICQTYRIDSDIIIKMYRTDYPDNTRTDLKIIINSIREALLGLIILKYDYEEFPTMIEVALDNLIAIYRMLRLQETGKSFNMLAVV